MSLRIPPPQLKQAEYFIQRGQDNEAERADIKRVLRGNGCRTVRFETRDISVADGFSSGIAKVLVAHGYIAEVHGEGMEPT